ncbi:hypothetical protein AB990_09655 [Alkalihalobacillus pseudalcaliphilus]|nr:hypothetical protein AB990_09655 [Alkalihalobacillus pseudalcaliphilus]
MRAKKVEESPSKSGIAGLRAEKAGESPSKRGISGLRAKKVGESLSKRRLTLRFATILISIFLCIFLTIQKKRLRIYGQ